MSDDIEEIDNPPIPLRTPVEDSGESITEVQVEELSIDQLESRQSIKNDMKRSIANMSDATGLSVAAVRQLKSYDFNRIAKRLGELGGLEESEGED